MQTTYLVLVIATSTRVHSYVVHLRYILRTGKIYAWYCTAVRVVSSVFMDTMNRAPCYEYALLHIYICMAFVRRISYE